MKKKYIILSIIVIVIFGVLRFVASLFGVGISFPPNVCDLKSGYALYGDQIFPIRDRCLLDLARREQNVNICNNLDKYLRNACIQDIAVYAKKDPSLCKRMAGYDKAVCIEQIAEITKNKDLCYELRDEDYLWKKCKEALLGGIASDEVKFTGTITDLQADLPDKCFFREAMCKLKVDDKWIIVSDSSVKIGDKIKTAGSFDIDFSLGRQVYLGKKVNVYAKVIDDYTYTLYGGEYEIRQIPNQ